MMLKALESLPSRLCDVYVDIVDRIMVGDGHQFDIAIKLFALMLRAARPPTFQEIQVSLAIVQGEDGPDLDEALIDVEDILGCCTDLVVGNFETCTLSFSHPTVRLFLQKQDAVNQVFIPLSTLNDRFPGLFDPAPSMGNENGRYQTVADVDDGESAYGSEGFSQLSRDDTLVPSINQGGTLKETPTIPLRGASVSEQLVKLFMADPALPSLVASALQRVGTTGFERTFSLLLKQYSKSLEMTASRPSQKVAAVWTGHATRQTSSLLRATVMPEDTEDDKLREAVLDLDRSRDVAVNEWLATQDAVLNPIWKGKIASRSGMAEPLAPVQLLNDERDNLSDKSDDEDLGATYTDLDAVKVFMTGSEPYMELKSSLIRQTHYGDQTKDLITRRMVPEDIEAVELQANTVTDQTYSIQTLSLIAILFIPLSFVCSIFGMQDVSAWHNVVFVAIVAILGSCVTAYIFIDLLMDESRLRYWMDIYMQNFWKNPFAMSMNARNRLSRLWFGILNWKEGFSDSLHVWKHGRRNDMTYFQWTCVSCSHIQRLF